MAEFIATDRSTYDWPELVSGLNRLLRLRTTPIGMKLFETRAEMGAVPRIRRSYWKMISDVMAPRRRVRRIRLPARQPTR